MGLLTTSSVAVDGSKFKAVNNRDRNFTKAKVERRRTQLHESVALPEPARYGRPADANDGSRDKGAAPEGEAGEAEGRDG
jgi:hypothetical protein